MCVSLPSYSFKILAKILRLTALDDVCDIPKMTSQDVSSTGLSPEKRTTTKKPWDKVALF